MIMFRILFIRMRLVVVDMGVSVCVYVNHAIQCKHISINTHPLLLDLTHNHQHMHMNMHVKSEVNPNSQSCTIASCLCFNCEVAWRRRMRRLYKSTGTAGVFVQMYRPFRCVCMYVCMYVCMHWMYVLHDLSVCMYARPSVHSSLCHIQKPNAYAARDTYVKAVCIYVCYMQLRNTC